MISLGTDGGAGRPYRITYNVLSKATTKHSTISASRAGTGRMMYAIRDQPVGGFMLAVIGRQPGDDCAERIDVAEVADDDCFYCVICVI